MLRVTKWFNCPVQDFCSLSKAYLIFFSVLVVQHELALPDILCMATLMQCNEIGLQCICSPILNICIWQL